MTNTVIFGKKKRTTEFRTWHAIILGIVLLVAIILGIVQRAGQPVDQVLEPVEPGPALLNEQTCRISGGTWNACGSACRTTPDLPCIELCVGYCECSRDDHCPFGFVCGDFVEGVGVCLSSS